MSIIEDYLASGGTVATQSTFTDDDQDVYIQIEFEEFSWRIQLGSDGPFFQSMSLIAAQAESQISRHPDALDIGV